MGGTEQRGTGPRRGWVVWLALLFGVCGQAARAQEEASGPAQIYVGAYINDVQNLDLETHSYAVDLYVWFRWSDAELSPADSVEFINPTDLWGHTSKVTYEESIVLPSGERYQVLRVQGRFNRKLLLYNFPYDRQELTVEFEDAQHEANSLVYVPDTKPIAVNPRLLLPGFILGQARLEVERFSYPTDFGDSRPDRPTGFSRVRLALPISRPRVAYSIKLLLPVLCVVLCASLMLLLRPSYVDARLGVGITALLTVVALQITTNDELPNVDYLILMDKVYVAAYVYILAGLSVVVRTSRLLDVERLPQAIALQRRWLIGTSLAFAAVVGLIVALGIWNG